MKLEAKTRLRAWEENPTTRTSMWRDMMMQNRNIVQRITEQRLMRVQKGMIHGFSIHCDPTQSEWYLFDDKTQQLVARVELTPFTAIRKVLLAAVNPAYQGKGIGFAFYQYLLRRFKKLSSSEHLSQGSSKMWAKLARAYKGVILLPTGERIRINGFKFHNGYVWPVVQRAGQLVSLGELDPESVEEHVALANFTYLVSV